MPRSAGATSWQGGLSTVAPTAQAGLTERLARASAAHPRRVLAAWGVAIVGALVLAATSLHGLTSSASVTGNPESARAAAAIAAAFPPTAAGLIVTTGHHLGIMHPVPGSGTTDPQ